MKHLFNNIPAILIAILITALTLGGCRENTIINSKLSPSATQVGVFDTIVPVITHTYYDDSALTSYNIAGIPINQCVGAILDPFFGTMTAATYFNVIPRELTGTIYTGATIDSAFVILPYSGFTYGDSANTSLTQTYQVFYLLDSLGYNSGYYSYNTKPIDAVTPLSEPVTVNLHSITDSMNIRGVNYQPGMRIKLNKDALMSRLTPAVNILDASTSPSTDFLTAFNGICVRVADTRQYTSAIPYFQLDGSALYSQAGIVVYYHTATVDSGIADYYFNTDLCSHFNGISRSYSRYPVNNLIHSTQGNDNIVALQNTPGANIDIVIPGIKNLPKGIINNATLMLTLLPGYNSDTFFAPSKLYPLGVGNGVYPTGIGAGLTYNVADRYPLLSTSPYAILDGYSHDITSGAATLKTFTLGIPREVMASMAANNDTIHLHITGSQDFFGAYRIVAGGGNYPDSLYRAKLKVVYSSLNK